jgi:heptosyltransferase-2
MRVLVLQVAALGDVVMASTLIGAVRDRWPSAWITWVTDEGFAPIVRRFDGLDEVIGIDAGTLLRSRSPLSRLAALWRAWGRIGHDRWDLVLIGHRDPRYGLVVRLTRARDRRRLGPPPGRVGHGQSGWMGEEFASLAGEPSGPPVRRARLARLRAQAVGEPPERSPMVLLAPGGGRNVLRDQPLKRWPIAQWVDLARGLAAAGVPMTLVGDRFDRREAEAICAAVPGVGDLIGRTSLSELLDLIASSDVLVTHDSGPMHLAMLARTPVVALFGPTAASVFIDPTAPVRVLTAASTLPCAPCYDGRSYAPCAANLCLSRVAVTSVMDAILAARRVA